MTTGLSAYEFKSQDYLPKNDDENVDEVEEEREDEEDEEEEMVRVLETEADVDLPLKEAKSYLSLESKDLYNHLAKVLIDMIDLRPKNAVDFFEALSLEGKKKNQSSSEFFSSISERNIQMALGRIQKKIFTETMESANEEEIVEEEQSQVKNLLESNYYFEQAGLGLHSTDTFKIFLSMKQLAKEKDLQNVRFWGKIFGLEQNYFVIEADFVEGNDEEEEEEVEEELEEEFEEEEEVDGNFLPLPKINYKPPPSPPKEEPGTGMNKKVYYVCNDPGKLWTKLPMVSPKQIFISRKIKKFFSGRLDAPIVSFPTFPGLEINYLRAQIARISAATHVSPAGYFATEEEEEGEADGELLTNAEYEALSIKEQFAAGLQGWVHHVPYILPQGRCSWWNPTPDEENEEEEEEEEEEVAPRRKKKPVKKAKPQFGPKILTSLNKDKVVDNITPWTIELSSNLFSEDGVVVIHSNLWPGANAFCSGNLFDNIYVGTGMKFLLSGFNPQLPRFLSTEYEVFGDELSEVDDPTVEEEFPTTADEEEEEEEEEELREGDDDDDDDDGGDEDD